MKIKLKRCVFHLIFARRAGEGGGGGVAGGCCFKNKRMLNIVFDVLYLNWYAHLHYSPSAWVSELIRLIWKWDAPRHDGVGMRAESGSDRVPRFASDTEYAEE